MRVTASLTMVVLSYFSIRVSGLVLRPTDSIIVKEPVNFRDLEIEYITELTVQNEAIDRIQSQLSMGGVVGSIEDFSELCNGLLESYYRQIEPRNRLVEISPTDSVLDSTSIEYLVAVASRYATNVMHLARKLRKGTFDEESAIEDLISLKKEHTKAQMFDQMLLGLIEVSLDDASITPSKDQNVSKPEIVESHGQEDGVTHEEVQPQVKTGEEEQHGDVIMKVEQEVITTTTETIVTSYTETSASW